MRPPRHSPATVPSRVVAVSALRAMGVRFQPNDTIPEATLAEVRPHSPRGMLPLISDEMPLYYAEAEAYIWRVVYREIDSGEKRELRGHVILVR